jgi:hypothetical protein
LVLNHYHSNKQILDGYHPVPTTYTKLKLRYLGKWRNETAERDDSTICEELGNLCHSPDILFSIFLREAQILVKARPDIVSVESVRGDPARDQESFQFKGY